MVWNMNIILWDTWLSLISWCVWAQSCPAFWDSKDCSPPGSSLHGISQARILEWVAISFSRESSRPRDWTLVSFFGRWILYHCTTWEVGGCFRLRLTLKTVLWLGKGFSFEFRRLRMRAKLGPPEMRAPPRVLLPTPPPLLRAIFNPISFLCTRNAHCFLKAVCVLSHTGFCCSGFFLANSYKFFKIHLKRHFLWQASPDWSNHLLLPFAPSRSPFQEGQKECPPKKVMVVPPSYSHCED